MTLGEKLQRVNQKVNTKLGKQDSPVVFRISTRTQPASIGQDYAAETHSDVILDSGIDISWITAYQTDAGGTIQVGDLKLKIPANLITEAQITGAVVLYGGQTYSIQSAAPDKIISEVPVNWLVVARLMK